MSMRSDPDAQAADQVAVVIHDRHGHGLAVAGRLGHRGVDGPLGLFQAQTLFSQHDFGRNRTTV